MHRLRFNPTSNLSAFSALHSTHPTIPVLSLCFNPAFKNTVELKSQLVQNSYFLAVGCGLNNVSHTASEPICTKPHRSRIEVGIKSQSQASLVLEL
jgi:hypothetical protein